MILPLVEHDVAKIPEALIRELIDKLPMWWGS